MNTDLTLAQHVSQVLDVNAAGMVQAESVFDWAANISTQAQQTGQIVIGALVTIFMIIIMVKSKFTIASVVLALIVGGGAIWVVVDGVTKSRDLIGETVDASVVQVDHRGEQLLATAPVSAPEGTDLR